MDLWKGSWKVTSSSHHNYTLASHGLVLVIKLAHRPRSRFFNSGPSSKSCSIWHINMTLATLYTARTTTQQKSRFPLPYNVMFHF